MAVQVITNQRVVINSVVLSDHVKSAVLTLESDAQDSTTMGDQWKDFLAGLRSGQLQINFLDDFAVGSVDATLWPIFSSGTGITTFSTRADAGAISTANPEYSGSIVVTQHSVGATVGELAAKNVTYPTTGAVSRATA